MKKVIVSSVLFASLSVFSVANAGYKEIECSTDPVFAQNSCSQCFEGGEKGAGSNIGQLDDVWINNSSSKQIMYKELNSFPEMINLNTNESKWKQTPSSDGFWSYTKELENIYDKGLSGYVLDAGGKVTFIRSALGSAYTLESNTAKKGTNIGLLVFPLIVNNIMASGEVSTESNSHKECVLFKSGDTKPKVTAKPKELPKTGPAQYFILLILAMVLAFGALRFKKS